MKKLKIIFLILIFGMAVGSCEYAFVAPEPLPPIDDGNGNPIEISFSDQIQPIFTSRCASCHDENGPEPTLLESFAYQNINNSEYINLNAPAASKIYSFVAPGASTHTHRQYTVAQAQLVLTWIQQGAKNN